MCDIRPAEFTGQCDVHLEVMAKVPYPRLPHRSNGIVRTGLDRYQACNVACVIIDVPSLRNTQSKTKLTCVSLLTPRKLLIADPLNIISTPLPIPPQTTNTLLLPLLNLNTLIEPPRSRQSHVVRIPKLHSPHLPLSRFLLRRSKQRRNSLHSRRRRRLQASNTFLRGRAEIMLRRALCIFDHKA
jgi:hypothetical protein